MLFAIVILAIVGVSNAWAGYAIKYQRRYHLIAGYDAKRDGEPEAGAGHQVTFLRTSPLAGTVTRMVLVRPSSATALIV